MLPLNIPILMVMAFLCLTIVIAFYCMESRTTFREYAIGNKRFSTATLVATVLATAFGGGEVILDVERVYRFGFFGIIYIFFRSFSFLAVSWLALRMAPFMQDLSMAETIGRRYGKYSRMLTALASVFSCIFFIAIQINAMAYAIMLCIDSDHSRVFTVLATFILIVYSTLGGVRVVALTDIVQLGAFFIVFPLLSWWIFIKIGNPIQEIISFLRMHKKYQLGSLFHFNSDYMDELSGCICSLVAFGPALIHRVYMSSNHVQASRVFLNSSIISLILKLIIVLIGLFVFVSKPDLPAAKVWNYIVANIPPVLKGCVVIGVLAMAMSTVDSLLNTCTIMTSYDMLESMIRVKAVPDSHRLWLAKLISLVIGLTAMIIAFYFKDIIWLAMFSADLFMPIVIVPFILAVLGFRSKFYTILIGMVTGILTIFIWNTWIKPIIAVHGSCVAMMANLLAVLVSNYVYSKLEERKHKVYQIDKSKNPCIGDGKEGR